MSHLAMMLAAVDAAVQFYDAGDLDRAAELLLRIAEIDISHEPLVERGQSEVIATAEEWLGTIRLKQGLAAEALARCYRAVQLSSIFRNRANYVSAEALLRIGDKENADSKLELILHFSDSPLWQDRAMQLLRSK